MPTYIALNPNGIRAYVKKSADELKKVFALTPDVLFFIETKMNSKPETTVAVEAELNKIVTGYTYHWSHCQRPGRHGTGVAIKKGVKVVSIRYNINLSLDKDEHESEGRCITVELEDVILVGLYVVNAGSQTKRLEYKQHWNSQLADYLSTLAENYTPKMVLVIGDLNVANDPCDMANPVPNSQIAGYTDEEREQFKKLLSSGWIDTWREQNPLTSSQGKDGVYTFWNTQSRARSRNAGWRIDYVLCDEKHYQREKIKPFILCDVMGSDHCPVGVEIVSANTVVNTTASTDSSPLPLL